MNKGHAELPGTAEWAAFLHESFTDIMLQVGDPLLFRARKEKPSVTP
jgi:hypothetical protein